MWTLPGYGDTSSRTARLRAQMAEMGAPGFEEVVAAINPIGEDQPDVPPTGASPSPSTTRTPSPPGRRARRSRPRAPFDAPWVRMSVIADPQGATFIASKFVPENRGLWWGPTNALRGRLQPQAFPGRARWVVARAPHRGPDPRRGPLAMRSTEVPILGRDRSWRAGRAAINLLPVPVPRSPFRSQRCRPPHQTSRSHHR